MTDERKPETRGRAEVSAKFVDEAEAAAGVHPSSASVPDDPLLSLRAERERLRAGIETTPEETEEDKALWQNIRDVEIRIIEARPQTLLDALAQIETLVSMAHEGVPDFAEEIIAGMDKQIPARIERLLAASFDDPEDAVPAVEDPVLALKREWEARYQALDEQRKTGDDSDEARQPFYDRLYETEVQILRTQATTLAGIAVKLILWARLHCTADEVSGLSWTRKSIKGNPHDLDQLPVMSALLDLERMSSGAVSIKPPAVPVIDEPLLALEQRWQEAVKAHEDAGIDTEEERLTESLEAQKKILTTPARSVAGVLVKLHVYAGWDAKTDGPPIDEQSIDNYDFDTAAVWGAMFDLERLARTTTVAEAPPAEDTALSDALAEYDRLVAIERNLERRADVFREGTPEAKEATDAHEAAWDEVLKAWKRVQKIPATTQAGLLARLQATDRFMSHLQEDDLYDEDWCIIKADVRRIAGEGSHDVPA